MPKQRRHRQTSQPTTHDAPAVNDSEAYSEERWPEAYNEHTSFDMSHYPGADDRHVPVYARVRSRPTDTVTQPMDDISLITTTPYVDVRLIRPWEDVCQPARGGGD